MNSGFVWFVIQNGKLNGEDDKPVDSAYKFSDKPMRYDLLCIYIYTIIISWVRLKIDNSIDYDWSMFYHS